VSNETWGRKLNPRNAQEETNDESMPAEPRLPPASETRKPGTWVQKRTAEWKKVFTGSGANFAYHRLMKLLRKKDAESIAHGQWAVRVEALTPIERHHFDSNFPQ
jgi:hypothetical protein